MIFIIGAARTGTSVVFQCLVNSGLNGGNNLFGHKYQTQDVMLNGLRQQVANGKYDGFDAFWRYAENEKLEVMKDPIMWAVFPVYWRKDKRFRDCKYIWTVRKPEEVARSAVRLQEMMNIPPCPPNPKLTFEDQMQFYKEYKQVLLKYYPETDSTIVSFENLLRNPEGYKEKLSEFVGREVDTSIVSKKETFEAKGTPQ